ncbi:preprotein translocase subunit TatA [Flexivirga oryzae]|uniref:Sec-independent protein translocase protein TatB n=1 Tax=Flexivirga oryzae TaxID=1794944 RepID=A0A839NC65_9MICO|nr:preprotein translocase subunit TatA [Flexivirga oryzae]MBB2894459.1 sec-independent protein translocase protein TatB [Flexivirga oryzae]
MFGISGWELVILLVLAAALIGPERLPEYVSKLRTYIRQARDMAEGAKSQLKDQMGPEFEDINWRAYDPRQYDPRKIVRDALFDPEPDPDAEEDDEAPAEASPVIGAASYDPNRFDPDRATPFDADAT